MEERFAFLAEWYDPSAALLRRYQLLFYPKDGSVEMFDVKNQRTFLRRTKYDELHPEDLFVGNRVNVFSRQLNLIDYGDQYTANKLGSKKERTLAMIKPDAVTKVGDIIQMIYDAGLIVTKARMTRLSGKQAADFYMEHQSKSFFNNLVQFVSSGPVIVMELMGDEAVSVWRKVLGPTDSSVARKDASASLRAQFGTDGTKNAGHGSDSMASAARELEFFFPSTAGHSPPNTAKFSDCTCCIIKPHAVSEGLTGKILNSITEAGFEISALQMFSLDRANAEEFLEVYKGVVTEYTSLVAELCSGPCMALEILSTDAPREFRMFCGPADPISGTVRDLPASRVGRAVCRDQEIARHLRPTTLRALYGKNKVQNAVHCTDLPEDGLLEVQYFFKILDG
ncbi:nucleoside diphosphate kinase 7 isoform X2 [Astyanax mexicanus]|uniref:nucleoside diphosphate kinase 7 isoform X2 n=1 Tax=Astyanax mexicanus TaxID=7994 RepID=UPI0020CB04F6|nr:nucleoside diphosphate kinase 7 isoform X2 [Astyanax mexicanus]